MRSLLRLAPKPAPLALPPAELPTPTARSLISPKEFCRPEELGDLWGSVGDAPSICTAVFNDQMRAVNSRRNRRRGRAWQDEFVERWVLHLRDHMGWMVGGRSIGERRFETAAP